MADLRFAEKDLGNVTLRVTEAGPQGGPLVLLLHGFPEFWFGWRHQIGALADAGYRVVVPDQRGYNLSSKPKGIAAYDLDCLARDVLALADCYGPSEFALIGHDWGAAVAWWFAQNFQSRLRRLAIMNAPHPALWRVAMDEDPEQRRLSRYVKFLGIPVLPEILIRAAGYQGLIAALKNSVHPLSNDELRQYRETWSQKGALTGMINWYRALLKREFATPLEESIKVPTLIIWGAKDKYGVLSLAEKSRALCSRGDLVVLPAATHWVQHDEAERVNAMLLEFLK